MRLKRTLFAAFTLLVFTSSAVARESAEARLQSVLDTFGTKYGFPGATVAVALPDGEIDLVATGLADVEAKTPMTPDTRLLAASIGKSFVAATVLALESDGILSTGNAVAQYLGNRPWFIRLPNHADMTIDSLLKHSAGLPDHVHDTDFQAEMASRLASGAKAMGPEAAIAFVLDKPALNPVGEGWSYSDTGYLLLGLIIEEVSGQSYYDLVGKRFLEPLSLNATTPSNTPALDGLAVGYTSAANPFGLPERTMDASGRLVWDPAMEWTGGGLVSTSGDLAQWGHALFNGDAFEETYLSRLLDGVPISPNAPSILYGAGVAIYAETPRGVVYGHGGWIPGYVSSLRHYADHNVTVAFQINTDVGIFDDSTDLVPRLEAALADLAISIATDAAGK